MAQTRKRHPSKDDNGKSQESKEEGETDTYEDSEDTSDGSETDRDTLGPLPAPGQVQPWTNYPNFSTTPSLGPIYNPAPPPSTYMSFAGPGPSILPINQSPRSVQSIPYKKVLW